MSPAPDTIHVTIQKSVTENLGISLKILTDDQSSGHSAVDFKECFEKAMKVCVY